MTANELSRAIVAGQWTAQELETLIEAVVFAKQRRSRQVVNTVTVGTQVKFKVKGDREVRGEVVKVNSKTVMVKATDGLRWKVAATLITPLFAP